MSGQQSPAVFIDLTPTTSSTAKALRVNVSHVSALSESHGYTRVALVGHAEDWHVTESMDEIDALISQAIKRSSIAVLKMAQEMVEEIDA